MNTTASASKEIVIIGRGIIALAAAYRFSEAGYKVILVGPKQKEGTASHAAVGLSSIKGHTAARTPLFHAKMLGHAQLEPWVKLIEKESGYEIPHDFSGVIEPFNSEEDLKILCWRLGRQSSSLPEKAKILSRKELSSTYKHIDSLHESVTGGISFCGDGWYDPKSMMAALEICLKKRKAVFHDYLAIKFMAHPQAGISIQTEHGIIQSNEVLLAAGAFSDEILTNSGLNDLKLHRILGHSLCANLLECNLPPMVKGKFSLITCKNELRFGASSFKAATDLGFFHNKGSELLKSELSKILNSEKCPGHTEAHLNWGFRARFKDRLPAIGEIAIPGNRKISVALGFYKNGLQLADLSARALTSQKAGLPFHPEIFNAFDPNRFMSSAALH